MEKQKEKIEEPYEPENTPNPPQRIDPDVGRKRENPVEEKRNAASKPENDKEKKSEKSHLLDENTDISDETTI